TILSLIYGKRTAEATERTAVGVEKLLLDKKESPDLEETKQEYLQYLINTNTYIDPRGIMQTRRSITLKLDEIYVTLNVEHETRPLDIERLQSQIHTEDYEIEEAPDYSYKESAKWIEPRSEIVNLA